MARSERPSFSFPAASITSGRSSATLLRPSHLPRPSSVTRSPLARLRSRDSLELGDKPRLLKLGEGAGNLPHGLLHRV